MEIKNSVALVTGTNRGVGRAIVEALVAGGARKIYAAARNTDGIKDLVAAGGGKVEAIQLDITNDAQVAAAAAHCKDVNLLVNNAGAASMNALLLTPGETAERLMRVNYLGTFHCLQAVGKVMVRQRAGRIVNVTTVAVPLALEGEAAYVASKAAVEALTRVAAKELAPSGVVVSAVGFGPVDTALTRTVPPARLEALNARLDLAASPTPAAAAAFLVDHLRSAEAGRIAYLGDVGRP